ncbi:MAG TPA: hypothetical protein GX703_02825, partial [Erysipelothrix sp.]|nr:hypothetical protein [Erysipelothrix sp.]
PEIGFFNDFFRDHIKGPSSPDLAHISGYALGDTSYIETAKGSIIGNTLYKYMVKLFNEPTQSVNYVECHDNLTLWDKISRSNPYNTFEQKVEKQKLTNGILCISQGILFLHYGQEMARTKSGIDNSYMSPDSINQITYSQTQTFRNIVKYTKDMIKLRKQLNIFSFNTTSEIKDHISFQTLKNKALQVTYSDVSQYCGYEEVKVLINPSYEDVRYTLNDCYKMLADTQGLVAEKTECEEVLIPAHGMLVIAK